MNQFKWWSLTLLVLIFEGWIAFSLFFAPGWANRWPLGLTINAVWSGGMAAIGCLMVMTLAVGLGAEICSILTRFRIEPRRASQVFWAWIAVWAIATAILGIVMDRTLFAETLKMWPNGYHP